MTPLRVLHLAANRWWTGSADPTIQLVSGLRARGHGVVLGVIPGDRFEIKAREAGLELVPGLTMSTHVAPRALARDLARLRQVVREQAIEIIHAHHSHDHWLAAGARGRRPGGGRTRVVRTFHNVRAVRAGRLARVLYRRTTAAFAVSHQIEARCREAGFPAERVHWTPGVADLARFDGTADPSTIREEFKLGDAPTIVCVSRLAPDRGHELLLFGYRHLLARLPAARLLLVGKGEARARLEQLVAALGLGDRVIFTGYRDHDLPAVLAAADCFVLMGAGSDESCRAALEAMAAARPVVARRVGALPETIVDGETGILLARDDPEALGRVLGDLLADPGRARAMGRAGRRRAHDVFGPERLVTTVERAYLALR
jgi:glycosyltransferase involved in cell wall biosynthesis